MTGRTWLLIALVVAVVAGGLAVYDRTGSCDPGPVTRAVKTTLGQTFSARCAG